MYNILIINYDSHSSDIIKKYLVKEIKDCFFKVTQSIEKDFSLQEKFDLIFIDIEMINLECINLLKKTDIENKPTSIFITSNDNSNMDVHILKTLYHSDKQTVKSFTKDMKRIKLDISNLNYIMINTKLGELKVLFNQIITIEVINRRIHLNAFLGEVQILNMKFKDVKGALDERFIEVDRSVIVNLDHIKVIERDYIVVEKLGKVQISRERYKYINKKHLERKCGREREVFV